MVGTPQALLVVPLLLVHGPFPPGRVVPAKIASGAAPGTLSIDEIEARLGDPRQHEPYRPELPVGLPTDISEWIPKENPLTLAKVELGRQLFFDPRLSRDGTIACASCHHPAMGWTDHRPVSIGMTGVPGSVSAPTIANRILGKHHFWDGRAATLEEQVLVPIESPIEMVFDPEELSARLNGIEGYRIQFQRIFGQGATGDGIARAIASFERTVLAGNSPYDYHEAAKPFHRMDLEEEEDPEVRERCAEVLAAEAAHPLSASARRGRELFFGKANCSACHVGWDLSDELFHNIGIGQGKEHPDRGRMAKTGDPKDLGLFKTPPLHNVAFTAPYMHDGSLATLEEVVRHYDSGGTPNANLSEKIFPLGLTEEERQDLVLFLRQGLSGDVTPVAIPRLP